MDKDIRTFTSLDAMKAEEYQDWQDRPGYERLDAAAALSVEAYELKEPTRDVRQGFQRTLIRLQRPEG